MSAARPLPTSLFGEVMTDRLDRRRPRHPPRQRPRRLHRPQRPRVPVPVELGLRLRRAWASTRSTANGPGPRSRRCSARNGPTASCRTSSSGRRTRAISPAPPSGRPARTPADLRHHPAAGRRHGRPAAVGLGASRGRGRRLSAPAPRRCSSSCSPGTAGSRASAIPRVAASSSRCTRGKPAATIRPNGTRPASRSTCRTSATTPAATPAISMRRCGRPSSSTTAIWRSSSMAARGAGTTPAIAADNPFQVADVGMSMILLRANRDLLALGADARPRRRRDRRLDRARRGRHRLAVGRGAQRLVLARPDHRQVIRASSPAPRSSASMPALRDAAKDAAMLAPFRTHRRPASPI